MAFSVGVGVRSRSLRERFTARSGVCVPRLLTPAVGVLLALFGTLAAVIGLAASSSAREAEPGGPATHRIEAGPGPRVATDTSIDTATDTTRDRRQRCVPGQTPPEYLHSQRIDGPRKHDPAVLRKASVDQLDLVQPGVCPLPTPRALPADIASSSGVAVQYCANRAFDGRAPPATFWM